MKRRPLVLVTIVFVAAVLFSLFVFTRYLNRSDLIRDQLLQLASDLPGSYSLEDVQIVPKGVRLIGFGFKSPDNSLQVSIQRILFDIHLGNLLTQKGPTARVITGVTLVQPSIEIILDGHSKSNVGPDSLPDLSEYDFLKRVFVEGGSIRLKETNGAVLLEAGQIDGWINAEPFQAAEYSFNMLMFEQAEAGLNLNGIYDFTEYTGTVNLSLGQLGLNQVDSAPLPVTGLHGNLAAELQANLDGLSWAGDGRWSLSNASLTVKQGPAISDINLSGSLVQQTLSFAGTCKFEGDDATVDGSVQFAPDLEIDGHCIIEEGRIGDHLVNFSGLEEIHKPQGTVRAEAWFRYHPKEAPWHARAKATADSLWTPIGPFRNVDLDCSIRMDDRFLSFDRLDADYFGLHAVAEGRWNPHKKRRFLVHVTGVGNGDPAGLPAWTNPIRAKHADVTVQITEAAETGFVVQGEGRVRAQGDPALVEVDGYIDKSLWYLNGRMFAPYQRSAYATMQQTGKQPVEVASDDPHLLLGWFNPEWEQSMFVRKLRIRMDTEVDDSSYSSRLVITEPETGFSSEVFGTLDQDSTAALKGDYSYSLFREELLIGNGLTAFSFSKDTLQIDEFSFKDYFSISGSVDFSTQSFINLNLQTEELSLSDLLPGLIRVPAEKIDGTISGRAGIEGPFRQPRISAHFDLYEGRFEDLDGYWGQISLDTDWNGNLEIQRGEFGRSEVQLFRLGGSYNMPEDELDLSLSASVSEADVISRALTGREGIVTGEVSFSGSVTGELLQPDWGLEASMTDAGILGINFNDVDIRLRGSSTKRFGHAVLIETFLMQQGDEYAVNLEGSVPLNRGGNIRLGMHGNLLRALPQIDPFFRDPRGSGTIDWHFILVSGRVVDSYGTVELNDASVQFSDVMPGFHDVNFSMSDSSGISTIHRCIGKIGDTEFEIRNRPGSTEDPHSYPITFPYLGFQLGVLQLKTLNAQGFPIRIPDVSLSEEYARLALSGKGEEDWFEISRYAFIREQNRLANNDQQLETAGYVGDKVIPTPFLRFSGEMEINDLYFTYPPENVTPGEPFAVVDVRELGIIPALLYRAYWDVEARVGRDVRFAREIRGLEETPFLRNVSGFFDQVDMEVLIEPTPINQPVVVSGRVLDESLRLEGEFVAERGTIELLDLEFTLQEGEVVFDESNILPVVSGRAVTVVPDRTGTQGGLASTIFLTLYVIDPITGERSPRGRWGEITFVLEDELGSSQEEILAMLGYINPEGEGGRDIRQVGGAVLVRAAKRWLRPYERDVEDFLGLDLVSVNPTVGQYKNPHDTTFAFNAPGDVARYFQTSSITVGKYVLPNAFLSYTSQYGRDFEAYSSYLPQEEIELIQRWNLEYRMSRISPNLLLEAEYEYDKLAEFGNPAFRLKYRFFLEQGEE
ncbi:hypothetical protein GF324_08920 [bacterium]|nr:hypothetical protein [bacterium]